MTDAARIEDIRRKTKSLHGAGYSHPNVAVATEACHDLIFLLDQLDKTQLALQQSGYCERCAEEDEQRAQAEDGMRNAAEIAGLQ